MECLACWGPALILSYRQNKDEWFRKWIWLAIAIGFGVSFLPNISMAGHVGGMIGGIAATMLLKAETNET